MLARVHLPGLASSLPPSLPPTPLLCYLSAAEHSAFPVSQETNFSRSFLSVYFWLPCVSLSVTPSSLFRFYIQMGSQRILLDDTDLGSRPSSLSPFSLSSFFFNSPSSPLCLLPLSPPRRVRRYSLECHFCSNLRRWSKQSKRQTCLDSLPLVWVSPANNNNHNKNSHDLTKICTGNLSFQALPYVTYTTEKTEKTEKAITCWN